MGGFRQAYRLSGRQLIFTPITEKGRPHLAWSARDSHHWPYRSRLHGPVSTKQAKTTALSGKAQHYAA